VPSVASQVSAARALAPSQRLPASTAVPDTDTSSFATLLDAGAGDSTGAPAGPVQAAAPPQSQSSATAPTTEQSTPRAAGGADAHQRATGNTKSSQGKTKPTAPDPAGGPTSTQSTMVGGGSKANAIDPTATVASKPTTQAGTAPASDADASGVAASFDALPRAEANSPAGDAEGASDAESKKAAGSAPTTAASDPPAAPDPPQPIAALPVLNTAANTTPATGGPAAGDEPAPRMAPPMAIGQGAQGRARVTISAPDVKDDASLTSDARDTAAGEPTPPPARSASSGTAASLAPDNSATAQGSTSGNPAQQAETPDGAAPVRGSETPPPTADRPETTASNVVDFSTSAAANGGTGAAKNAAEGLPNFGYVAASSAAPSAAATAATAGTASTGGVAIAGLAVAIAAHAQGGSNQFDIRLDPPELGRINVHLALDRDGQVTSHVTVERADTLDLLQSQQSQLQRALEQAGLKTADNGLQFTLRDQSFAGQNNGGGQPNAAQLVVPDPDLPPVTAAQAYSRTNLGAGIDIRV